MGETAVRILFLTPFLPHPAANHGGGSYVGALADGLRQHAELGLVHLRHPKEEQLPPDTWSWHAAATYQGGAGGLGHRLRMLWRWRSRPLLAAKYWQPELAGLIQRARAEFQPNVVLVEMAQMAQYLPLLRGLPTILTDHEAGRPANRQTGLGASADQRDDRLWNDFVRRFYAQASAVQAVTQEDADVLATRLETSVTVRPPTIAIPAPTERPPQTPPHALFLGDYRHGPNPEAATKLAEGLWPLVRAQIPDAELLLAGPNGESIRRLDEQPGVRVVGFVPDLGELFRSVRVVLSPLWSGGGFRVKSATALAHGLPIITNELGSRGCRAPEPACSVGESMQELCDHTVRHLTDQEHATTAGQLARTWASERYAADAVARLQLQRIEELLASGR